MDKCYVTVCKKTGTSTGSEITEEIARRILNRWIKLLHLEEWNIQFCWRVRASDMNDPGCVGCTTFQCVDRQAIIQMLDPIDYPSDRFAYDYEKVLVHELLHLTFADLDSSGDGLRDYLTHCMVDRMARALVAAERTELMVC